ncbi:MAG: radical SAM protein [Thermodesulfobacteriota bacterium]|nr:radical SAM protein [Thermodesulfobacteriota bacterium]
MAKILFIYPNLNTQVGFNYGLAYISGVLKKAGHETRLLNINEDLGYPLDFSRIKSDIISFSPDLIGFSALTNQFNYIEEIARKIKGTFKIPIICGGIHATMDPEGVLNTGLFDYVCVGEGEYALLELLESLKKGIPSYNIPNIWYRTKGEIIKNKVRPFVDLNSLPFKDYELFDFQNIIKAKNGWVGLMTSRGCPFRCSYCFNHQMVNIYKKDLGIKSESKGLNYMRRHPLKEIISEIKYLKEHYQGIKTFIFDDDLFTLNKDYIIKFCEAYANNFDIPFVVNAHVKVFDREIAGHLKEAGCQIVKFGLESGSERLRRKILNRQMTNREILEAFNNAHEFNLHSSAFVIIGFPYEERKDLLATIKLLSQIKPGRFRWSIFFPYINTEAYNISKKGGFIDFKKMESLSNFTDWSCLKFSPYHDLFIKKLKMALHWYVNGLSDFPSSSTYKKLVEEIENMDLEMWERFSKDLFIKDEKISSSLQKVGKEHYAIKYNDFMAVKIENS